MRPLRFSLALVPQQSKVLGLLTFCQRTKFTVTLQFHVTAALTVFFLVGCRAAPQPLPVPANTPNSPTATPLLQRAPLLRIAIFGEATTTNVWALFDEAGADYWNYATQAGYWPSLYHLSPLSLDFEPAAAKGMPPSISCDGDICSAPTVTLQPGLSWTDRSPLTANDVAFTVNTAIQFRLGLNWQQAYNPNLLYRAEALDETTVRFYFNYMPNVADWQYGVLQGPIVNQAYWRPRIADAASLLPDETLLPTIRELESEFADLQTRVDDLNLSLNTMAPASKAYQDTSRQAKRFQEELNSIANKIDKNRTEYETKLAAARGALFVLANATEPTLGAWMYASRIEDSFENQANFGTPFGDPWFDSVRYITYPNELRAVQALENDDVDIILTPEGLSLNSVSRLEDEPGITLSRSITRSARFLVFNHANPYLAEPPLHQALTCMLDPQALSESLDDSAVPLSGFVLDGIWRSEEASLPCADETGGARLKQAVNVLKTAGYSWSTEPAPDSAGMGFRDPGGNDLPRFTLLVPEDDPLRVSAAEYIAQQADVLGLSLEVRQSDSDTLLYAVYGSGDYDMALLGWRLSAYPAYLCEWFTPIEQNPFDYKGSRLKTECEAWNSTNDLERARVHASEIQSILALDLPLIPLYVVLRTDAYQNIYYPFENLIDGLARLYGAPTLAIPIP